MNSQKQAQEEHGKELSSKFPVGAKVRYIPLHAEGNKNHPACEDGIVSSVNNLYVFVKYKNFGAAVATNPDLLIVTDIEEEESFPSSKQAKKILAEEGVDASRLLAWTRSKLSELKD